jgi:hypothetical protein
MIPRKAEHTLEVQGNISTKRLTIAANAVAFRALIDGMYADKIGSIMRELWTNAWDAQVEAGLTDTPFEVRLPTSLNPTFHVLDNGVSMTHETVMEVFTTMFESTKRESNLVAGKFGVGSKSPLSYTDAYTVTCFLDGEVRVYSVHIGSDGAPEVALMQTGPTDRGNGLMVAFPVDREDFQAFYRAASRTSLGFDVKPIINVGEEAFEDLPEIAMEHANWKVYKNTKYKIGLRIKMGCVTYPVDREFLSDELRTKLGPANFVVEVPIGACDVNLSREALSYDDETVVNLQAAFAEAIQSVEEHVTQSLDSAETYEEACRIYINAVDVLEDVGIAAENLPASYRGIPLKAKSWIPENWITASTSASFTYFTRADRPTLRMSRDHRFSRSSSVSGYVATHKYCHTSLFVITQDTESTPYLGDRVRQYIEDNQESLTHVRQVVRLEISRNMRICKETLRTMLLGVPDTQIVIAQDLPLDRSRIPRPVPSADGRASYHYMVGGTYRISENLRDDIDCYVLTAGAHTPDGAEYDAHLVKNYSEIISNLRKLNYRPVIIHLPKKDRDRKDDLDLPDFFDVARKKLKSACSSIDPVVTAAYRDVAQKYGTSDRDTRRLEGTLSSWVLQTDLQDFIEETSSASPLVQLIYDHHQAEVRLKDKYKDYSALGAVQTLMEMMGTTESISADIAAEKERIQQMFDKFASDFPMTAFIHEPRRDDENVWGQADFIDYLNSK